MKVSDDIKLFHKLSVILYTFFSVSQQGQWQQCTAIRFTIFPQSSEMINRVEECMVAARRVWGFIWKECTGLRAPYYIWHPQMPCVHIITTLNWGFFSPHFLYFHHLLPQVVFSGTEEKAVLLKEGQWLSGGPGGGEWRAIKGHTVWVDALLLHAEVSWSVTDLSVTPVLYSQPTENIWFFFFKTLHTMQNSYLNTYLNI